MSTLYEQEGKLNELKGVGKTIVTVLGVAVVLVIFSAGWFLLFHCLTELVIRNHWAFGLSLGLVYLVFIVVLLGIVRSRLRKEDREWFILLLLILASLVLCVLLFALTSWLLQKFSLGNYEVQVNQGLAPFVHLYLYELVELLPGLDVSKTLHIPAPKQPQNWVAGIPVVIYRLLMILGVVAAIRDLWKRWDSSDS